jgi:hypothetical protein
MLVTAVIQGNHETWIIAAVLCPVTILVVWIVALTIGCLVMIPVGIWRLRQRLARERAWKVTPQGQLWDRWMDGSGPCDREPIGISDPPCNDQNDSQVGGHRFSLLHD